VGLFYAIKSGLFTAVYLYVQLFCFICTINSCYAALLKASAIAPIMTDISTYSPSVCLFVTLVHPAKTIGQNEMPFGRDTSVAPIALY